MKPTEAKIINVYMFCKHWSRWFGTDYFKVLGHGLNQHTHTIAFYYKYEHHQQSGQHGKP